MVGNWLKTNSWVLEELGRCVFSFSCLSLSFAFSSHRKRSTTFRGFGYLTHLILFLPFSFEAIHCFSI